MKILIVDDDALKLKMIEKTLTIGGYDVIVLDNAEAAKGIVEEDDVRFVITDWMMPGLDGPSVVRWIRSAHITSDVNVILLTARETPAHIEDDLKAAADAATKKPLTPRQLQPRLAGAPR